MDTRGEVVSSLLPRFVKYLGQEQGLSDKTLQAYQHDLEAYASYCEQRLSEELTPGEKDLDLIRGWLSSLMDRGDKASSVGRRLYAVKAFYKYLLRIGYISSNPASLVRAPKRGKPLPVYVPTAEIERILETEPDKSKDSLENIRDRLIIMTLYECGLRRSELASLRNRDVDLIEKKLKVVGKGRKERIVPFGEGLAEQMQIWKQERDRKIGSSDSFFVTLSGKAMTGAMVYRIVHKALESVPNLSRRGAHALRHSFATDMLNSGADLVAIKELMGHSSISTTVQYTHTSFRQLQAIYTAHPRATKATETMDIRIQALHFDASESLQEFIYKKLDKLSRFADESSKAEVILKVTKPEVSNNKNASIRLISKGLELFAEKQANTFEEAIDDSIDALKHQIERNKEAHR